MEKKSKKSIIIGISVLLLVTLTLLGLTYAYYRTRVIGNESETSISVTSKKLEIAYLDGNGFIEAHDFEPGDTLTKTFSVTNNGDKEVTYYVYLLNVVNEFTSQLGEGKEYDMTYDLVCTSNCNGKTKENYPQLGGQVVLNTIAPEETQTYTFTLNYEYLENIDQSDDMGKKLSGLFQIYTLEDVVDIEGTVANAEAGDYVQINSEKKTSMIIDGKYRLSGVEAGSHTLKIMNKNNEVKASTTLTINKGTSGINGNTITISDDAEIVTLNITNIDKTNKTITINATNIEENPLKIGTPNYYAQIGQLKVGDYVIYNYTPGTYTTTLVDDDGVSQSFDSGSTNAIANNKWRVLSVDNNTVQIMPDIREVPKLQMYGEKGYLNGPTVLNEMSEALYSGDMGTARSINIDDIDKKVGYTGVFSYTKDNTLLITNSKILEELEQEAGVTIKDEYRKNPDATSANGLRLNYYTYWLFDRTGTTPIATDEANKATISNPLTQDWRCNGLTIEFKLLAFYTFSTKEVEKRPILEEVETYTEEDVSPYWIADAVADITLSSTNSDNSYIKYGMRLMNNGNVTRRHMWNPKEGAQDADDKPVYGVVPVVTLKNDLQIEKNSSGQWELK